MILITLLGVLMCSRSASLRSTRSIDTHGNENECLPVCTSKACLEAAKVIISLMDPTVDPCEDFYNFSCGGFIENHDKSTIKVDLHEIIKNKMTLFKDIIETSEKTHVKGSDEEKLKIVYDSCMDADSFLPSLRKIQDFLEVIGIQKWPFLDSTFTFLNPTLEEILAKLIRHEEAVFFEIDRDFTNNRFNIYAPKPTYDKNGIEEMRSAMNSILHNAQLNQSHIRQIWEDFLILEEKNQELIQGLVEEVSDGPTKDIWRCDFDNVLNQSIICRVLDVLIRTDRFQTEYKREYHLKRGTHFARTLHTLLETYNDRIISNYISVRLLLRHGKYMSFLIQDKMSSIFRRISRIDEQKKTIELDRWRFCTSLTMEKFPVPFLRMFDSNICNNCDIQINLMIEELTDTLVSAIEKQHWLTEETKKFLTKKIKKETDFALTRYLQTLRNDSKFGNLYRNLYPDPKNFIRNIIQVVQINRFNALDTDDLDTYNLDKFSFNDRADYDLEDQVIVISPTKLLPNSYFFGAPMLVNLARIFGIILHEYGHAVFSHLHRVDDAITAEEFNKKKECLINQYSNFKSERTQKNLMGNITLEENYGDNLSLQLTEKIMERHICNVTEDNVALPALPYSAMQLFYINWAQTECAYFTKEHEQQFWELNRHSPGRYRALGILQNSEMFSTAFHCPSSSYMNSEEKCLIFD